MTAPRIFGISASDAPVVAILRRGPSDWFHVGRFKFERSTASETSSTRSIFPI